MKDPADNKTIDMQLENFLVEVRAQVLITAVARSDRPAAPHSGVGAVVASRAAKTDGAGRGKRSNRRAIG